MTAEPNQTAGPTGKSHRHHLSSDGKWRSFPKTPHLLQYVSRETFYGRTKVNGKIIRQIIRQSLETASCMRAESHGDALTHR